MENLGLLIGVGAGALVFGAIAMNVFRNLLDEKRRYNASREAERIVAKAEREAVKIERDANRRAEQLEDKIRKSTERDIERKMQSLDRTESQYKDKEKALDRKLKQKEQEYQDKLRKVRAREEKLDLAEKKSEEQEQKLQSLLSDYRAKLESVSNYSAEEAKKEILEIVKRESEIDAAKLALKIEEEAKSNAERNAKKIISQAISRYSGEYVVERSTSVVELPSEDVKGKIIGKEGRNIRALEMSCGVDVIIDESPDAVLISGFDPVRRELAKRTLEKLIEDGRIHPSRIEEVLNKEKKSLFKSIQADGEKACHELDITGVNPEILKLIGSLKYRTSYTQNNYTHSIEVGFIAGMIADQLGLDVKAARRADLLHDIGKALDHSVAGSHAVIGADFAKRYGESELVVHAIRAHHEDEKPSHPLAWVVQAADALSSARPGARKQTNETFVNRVEELESVANSFDGVIRSFALQAGREIRVFVEGSKINDQQSVVLSRDIARKIEKEMTYPGQIKVAVIREIRAVDHAR